MVLSQLDDGIYLSEINFAGTHDSCTAFVSMENMARCQSLTVKQQLRLGIRLFDIRLSRSGNEFYLVHAIADCYSDSEKTKKLTFSEVLSDFREFLKENPREVLIVSIKQDRGIMSRNFFPAFYDKYIKGNENEWYLKNENPTLGLCRGKAVLMRRCKVWKKYGKSVDAGLDFSRWPDQKATKTTPKTVFLNKKVGLSAVVQDRYCLDCKRKWFGCAKPFLNTCITDKNSFALHYISTSYRKKGETLVETAEEMNGYFKEYELRRDKAQGWFFLDFPDKDIVEKINCSNQCIYSSRM